MLTEQEELQLQQLRLLESAMRRADANADGNESPRLPCVSRARLLPDEWSLIGDTELWRWQTEALKAWFDAGCRGTIKVVTGAGKTILALAIAERLQRRDPDLRVAVVVPTIVLMQQWFETIADRSNMPRAAVGRLGGGHTDDLEGDRRILISVLASARKALPALAQRSGAGDHLLLVIDESHRAGAPEMSQVLKTDRAYTLGLSATPERGDGSFEDEDENETLTRELGDVVFELSYADAIREGILPPFEVHHYGLPLDAAEAQEYATLTRSINDTRRELTARSPAARKARGSGGLLQWARKNAGSSGDMSALAARYVNDSTRRKQLLYRAESRTEATLSLVRQALAERAEARVILFHESIDEVADLFERMMRSGIPAVMEHSELSQELRDRTLELFRRGTARVIVSARSLIEGFNVPAADLGIIVASSASPRQRIQSIGRVLRKFSVGEGEEKSSRICVLYVRDTVDETIYEKQDWDRLIGVDRNRYFAWDPPSDPIEQSGSPRAAIPDEEQVDVATLKPGDLYPARYQGAEYSVDTRGNVVDADRHLALNPQGVPELVIDVRGKPGRFRVTPRHHAILVRANGEDGEWSTRFAGQLKEPFRFPETPESLTPGTGDLDVAALSPGDDYPGPLTPAEELRFRQRQGGVIARKVRGGETVARGVEAERLLEALRKLTRTESPLTRFYVNELGHAFWREAGRGRFIAALEGDLGFPK